MKHLSYNILLALLSFFIIAKNTKAFTLDDVLSEANGGDVEAQKFLGAAYTLGDTNLGIEKNLVESFKWFQKAADQKDPSGQYSVGFAYLRGWGVSKDEAQAFKWVSKSADQGFPEAENLLGLLYLKGNAGVREDKVEAAKWFRKAAEHGLAYAQFELGRLYFSGEGVPRDYIECYALINLAAVRYPGAMEMRDKLEGILPPDQRAEGQRRSKELAAEWTSNN